MNCIKGFITTLLHSKNTKDKYLSCLFPYNVVQLYRDQNRNKRINEHFLRVICAAEIELKANFAVHVCAHFFTIFTNDSTVTEKYMCR